MKRSTAILTHVAVLALGVTLGYAGGFMGSWSSLWDQLAVRESNDLINRINVLGQLRLDRTSDAIRSLERWIETQVLHIAYAEDENLTLNVQSMPRSRLQALRMAKAYREIYPAQQNSVRPPPSVVFDQVPSINVSSPPKECNSAFCALLASHSDPEPGEKRE